MKQFLVSTKAKWLAAASLALAAPLAGAGDVSWSVSVGTPYPAAPVYVAPPPVVYAPQPVYVRPRPVYVQPATVVQYGPTYYVEQPRHRKHKHWKHHHRHDHGYRYDY
jgi:hypothetical protein